MKSTREDDRCQCAWPKRARTRRYWNLALSGERIAHAFAPRMVGTGRGWKFILAYPSQRKLRSAATREMAQMFRRAAYRIAAEE